MRLLRVGDSVLGYNERTGEIGFYTVTDTISHVDETIIHLTIDGELLETTAEHPFFTNDGLWVDAGELEIGERILSMDGDYGTVEAVIVIEDANQPMYNLTVAEVHTFMVGEGEWVVHNCGGKSGTPPDFVRFGNEAEASAAASNNRLAFPESGVGNRQEKWIATYGSTSNNASFGNSSNYTHRMDISVSGDSLGWLNRNAVDYDAWRTAIDEGLDTVPGTNRLLENVLVVTKPNEPGWYGLTEAGLGLFNRNITDITSIKIR